MTKHILTDEETEETLTLANGASWRSFARAIEAAILVKIGEAALTVRIEPDYMSGGHFYEGRRPYIKYSDIQALTIGTPLYAIPFLEEE